MSAPSHYLIKNWSQFQHYKDRNPTWIKMHFAILASEDWVMLPDASKLLAVVCMLVASRHEGRVPNKPAYLKRIAYLDQEPNLQPLIECGFLSIPLAEDSTALAGRSELQADARPETEAYRDIEDNKIPEAKASGEVVSIDARTALWRDGVPTLASVTGKSVEQCKRLVGQWLKRASDDAAKVHAAINRARDQRVIDPVPWIVKALDPPDVDAAIYRGVL